MLGGQYICDCVNINIYIYYLICPSYIHKSIRQYHDSIFGALIHWYVYIYIYIQCLGRDHVGLSQNNVSPNPSVESRIHDRPMCLGRMSAMLSLLSLSPGRASTKSSLSTMRFTSKRDRVQAEG